MKFDLKILEKYWEEGMLIKQIHPLLPLTIWNYSESVQYEDSWDEVLIHCRGLITDEDGNVIAKPFKKFFNIEQNKHTPSGNFSIWEKVDGSLGIMFFYENDWIISTRGSFTSEQAIEAINLLKKYKGWEEHFNKNYTYLFEIIYKENQIVVDYGKEMLVLLGAVDKETGEEFTPDVLGNAWFPVPYRYIFLDGDTFEKMKALNYEGEEGFVVHFDNGEKCKIKFAWYLERHRVVWLLTNTLIWEYLSTTREKEIIEMVPDEYHEKVKIIVGEFQNNFCNRFTTYEEVFHELKDSCETRKDFAERAKTFEYPQILFKMYDENDIDKTIWKTLKPEKTVKILTK
jgi:RNA ligase